MSKLDLVARNHILSLLSDTEVARLSNAESRAGLQAGEEYLDLDRLDRGVRVATGIETPQGSVLAKNAVESATWTQVLTKLAANAS
jgi:hypothetical protein